MQLIDIPGIGDKTIEILNQAGIVTPEQLLQYYPRAHRFYYKRNVSETRVGEWTMLTGAITKPFSKHTGRVSLQNASLSDNSGTLTLRWFNSLFIVRTIKTGTTYEVMGKIEVFAGKKQLVNPQLRIFKENTSLKKVVIMPIYTPISTLKSGHLRNIIKSTLEMIKLTDPLRAETLAENHLYPLKKALKNIHFPENKDALESAIHRLGFDELVALQTESLILKESLSPPTTPLLGDEIVLNNWLTSLPFVPTNSQSRVIKDIISDLSKPLAMHRLITGDVGSGKTLVAAASALWTVKSNHRVLVLAPTMILAEQLHTNLKGYLPPNLKISLITRSQKGSPEADIVVGTHAILQSNYKFSKVGLVIIDEQHRFGVKDREKLRVINPTPHLLMLSATPIPRTLAMTTLSHLDISPMPDTPKNRLPTKSYVISKNKRADAYNWIKREIQGSDQQAFIVTPLIELAENEEESPKVALNVLEKELKANFPSLKIDYVHGKMKETEKTDRLQKFRNGESDILVATSMIEVGIDIPKANIILIENAELFGLSTLHQLRGRVGRGGGQGHCLLVTSKTDQKTIERLAFFVREKSGSKLAEYDLKNRGPGDIFGTLQSGSLGLRFASLSDTKLLKSTRQVASLLVKTHKQP
ncbi:MAG: ATP-dependent DNA helicase RecG [Candidatus Microgenomates bacterium]